MTDAAILARIREMIPNDPDLDMYCPNCARLVPTTYAYDRYEDCANCGQPLDATDLAEALHGLLYPPRHVIYSESAVQPPPTPRTE